MKRLKRIISIVLILGIILSTGQVFAANSELTGLMKKVEFTEDFKKWLELSDEEKAKIGVPRSINVSSATYTTKNPIKLAHNVGSATLDKFTLQDYIPENLVVRNQMETGTCWAFASLGMLESTLALDNYNNGKNVTVYDFSERHMQYATTRVFANGEINERGFNKSVTDGGNNQYSMPYLLSGFGPIKELDMPFENNEDIIELSKIQNKETVARIKDTVLFPTYTGENKAEIMQLMKEHIKKYGGIEAGVNGAQLFSDSYNLETGAMYSDNEVQYPYNHDVVIVGWDDNYPKENFNEEHIPPNDGAWIVKNSWGTRQEHTLEEVKEIIWEIIQYGGNIPADWKKPEDIPDDDAKEMFKSIGYRFEGNTAVLDVGKDGFMYLSYDDVNVYKVLMGVENATDEMYDYIYQYDYLGAMGILGLATQKPIIANIFDKQSNTTEYLTEVGLEVLETTTCKVYVNPNNDGMTKQDFVQVELKAGNTETVDAGYHTLELLNPIELTGDKFVVAIELTGTKTDMYKVATEIKIENSAWSVVELEEGKGFWTTPEFFGVDWIDFSKLASISQGQISNSDNTIKAFTVLEENKDTKILDKIEITTPPTKTKYVEGEDFDKTGMVVSAIYTNGTKEKVTGYTIQNGTDLKLNQETVIVEYQGKVATQEITVTAKTENPGDEKPDDGKEPSDTKEKPEVSDFSKVSANVKSVKAYYFTNKDKKEYITIDLALEKITRKENNDSYQYYYYLSSSPSQKNITKWVKIEEEQNSNTKLEFLINTKDISNYTEVSKAEKLYLYIKEVVTKEELTEETTTNAILLETEGKVEIYKDNVKQSANNNQDDDDNKNNNNNNDNNNSNNGNNNNDNKDNSQKDNQQDNNNKNDDTTADKKLPAAGLKVGIILVIAVVAIFGIIKFIQYKKMDF